MNKTLLIILVDFLLLTLLSLTEWEKDRQEEADEGGGPERPGEESVSAMAMMERDLLESLQASLQEQRREQQALLEEMRRREEALREARERAQEKDEALSSLQSNLESVASKAAELEEETREKAQALEGAQSQYERLAREKRQTEAQSRRLQEELQRRRDALERREKALAEAREERERLRRRAEELNAQARVAQEQKRLIEENFQIVRKELEAEREQRAQAQQQAAQLAEGVTELAEQSQDLRQEIRSSVPINANQLFSDYRSNRVQARFAVQRRQRNRVVEETGQASTVVVSDGQDYFAVAHVDSIPLDLEDDPSQLRRVSVVLSREGARLEGARMGFLVNDPRLVAIPMTEAQAETLGGEVYYTALEPFKFPEAVLVNAQGDYYGEVEFKLDPETPGYVRMKSRIFNRLFGEFSPSAGDIVLSKTGELLGLMVNRRQCALVDNFLAIGSFPLGQNLESGALAEALQSAQARYRMLPSAAR